jgi:hypothetical protein
MLVVVVLAGKIHQQAEEQLELVELVAEAQVLTIECKQASHLLDKMEPTAVVVAVVHLEVLMAQLAQLLELVVQV